jgi:hypothetical protein
MKTWVHIWQYLAEFFLQREIVQSNVFEKIIKIFFLNFSPPPPRKPYRLWDNVKINVVNPDRSQMTQYGACSLHARYIRQEYRHTQC